MPSDPTQQKSPSSRQILGAKIRTADEAYDKKHRRVYGGGYIVPSNAERRAHLAKRFSMTEEEIACFLTWSRACTHPWSAGACPYCPE